MIDKKIIYLDNAATTWPKPEIVYQTMDKFCRKYAANPGRSSHRMAIESERVVEGTRHTLARFFNVRDYKRLIFTFNCTDALNMAIKGLLRKGDHVITSTIEHNSVSRPLTRMEQDGLIKVTRLTPDAEGFVSVKSVEQAFRKNTKLVALIHASNVLGTIQDIRSVGSICRKKEVFLLVDAAQTAGVIPIDMEKDCIDLLAFPGHKSLFGPPGTGGLCIGDRIRPLAFWREGGTGSESVSALQPEVYPHRMEAGTVNFVGIAGLQAGINYILKEGVVNIRKHEIELMRLAMDLLNTNKHIITYGTNSAHKRVGLLSFNIHDPRWDLPSIGSMLDQTYGILVRTGHHCAGTALDGKKDSSKGSIRISPGYFTSKEDIEYFAAKINELLYATC